MQNKYAVQVSLRVYTIMVVVHPRKQYAMSYVHAENRVHACALVARDTESHPAEGDSGDFFVTLTSASLTASVSPSAMRISLSRILTESLELASELTSRSIALNHSALGISIKLLRLAEVLPYIDGLTRTFAINLYNTFH